MTVVTPTEAGTGGLGLTIIDLVAYLYSDDGLVVSTQPERLQRAFDVLTGLLGWFGLRMNTRKTFSMSCQPCHNPGLVSSEVYKCQTTCTGLTFQEQQRRRVYCPECGVVVAAELLLTHRQSQHGMGRGYQGG